ncbi:carbohydrate ABC transporter permease [Vallitalea okinawensis]|uniref:carbohydrate ABC transporter permease n=1 Tax=Vallitalea okinawensis TaxID=2078660 RepID=UPI001FA91665|nr:carbohydrate ABC transporter permease [Vallitalea okinawensis]
MLEVMLAILMIGFLVIIVLGISKQSRYEIKEMFSRQSTGSKIFDIVNIIFMLLICFIMLYPVWYVLILSFNEGSDAMMGGIYWWVREFTLDNYKIVLSNNDIFKAFIVTVARTVIGTTTHVLFTAMIAYSLSKRDLVGRKIWLTMGIITMFFSGGLIPTFILFKNMNLLDSFWVYIIPTMFSFYDLIIFQSFFRGIPDSLEEAATIDGAGYFYIFRRIILPLSKPVLATIALFCGVWHWNDYFMGVIYITKNVDLQPIQTYLYRIVAESASNQAMANMPDGVQKATTTSGSIKLATMVVTTLPIVLVYPFLQKYFVKGMLLGSVKG